jgi:hypothetical protein
VQPDQAAAQQPQPSSASLGRFLSVGLYKKTENVSGCGTRKRILVGQKRILYIQTSSFTIL